MSKRLKHSVGDVVQQLLIDLGLGAEADSRDPKGAILDWPVYSEKEGPSPDNAITCYTTTPQIDGRSMTDGEQSYHWAFQVRVRGLTTQRDAWLKAGEITRSLNEEVLDEVVTLDDGVGTGQTSYEVQCASGVTAPTLIGRESPSSNRSIYTLNGYITIRVL